MLACTSSISLHPLTPSLVKYFLSRNWIIAFDLLCPPPIFFNQGHIFKHGLNVWQTKRMQILQKHSAIEANLNSFAPFLAWPELCHPQTPPDSLVLKLGHKGRLPKLQNWLFQMLSRRLWGKCTASGETALINVLGKISNGSNWTVPCLLIFQRFYRSWFWCLSCPRRLQKFKR